MKPKIAFFDFAGCEGDQLQVANLEEKLLDLISHVEVVSFREVMTGHSDDYDIAFVEGAITRPEDEARIKDIRAKAKYLVALGACATIGGVNCIKNFMSADVYKERVYGASGRWYSTYAARPLKKVVKVDAEIHGCPIDRGEFARVVKELLLGRQPWLPDYPVCVECKKAGNICRYDLGRICLGTITRAGCGACCVTEGAHCWGCRGVAPKANLDAAREAMNKNGFDHKTVRDLLRFFLGDTYAPL
jgi:coenzyme F420-reducing hydrogenase gamma subunit